MGYLDISNVTDVSGLFSNCTSLEEYELSSTCAATSYASMFQSCRAIKEFPYIYDYTNATSVGYMFYQCENLQFNSVLNFNMPICTDVENMFGGCKKITSIGDIYAPNATNTQSFISGCSLLDDVGDITFTSAIYMSNTFIDCPNLSDNSLNKILYALSSSKAYNKNLKWVGLSQTQATKCTTLSNWSACQSAGWTTGY